MFHDSFSAIPLSTYLFSPSSLLKALRKQYARHHFLTSNKAGVRQVMKPGRVAGAQKWRSAAQLLYVVKKTMSANRTLLPFSLPGIFALTLAGPVTAQTYWLNIPGAYSKVDEQYLPSMSFPTPNHNACSDAVVHYAKNNLVHYIGCDVKPLPDAVNLQHRPSPSRKGNAPHLRRP